MSVLVCDDDDLFRRAMARVLDGKVLQAASIAAALALAKKSKPHVLLLDSILPDGIGWEWIPKFRAASPYTEVVVMTAHGRRSDAIRAIGEHGAFAYLDKSEGVYAIRSITREAFVASLGRVGAIGASVDG